MATILEIQYVKQGDYPNIPVVKKIRVPVDKRIIIKRVINNADVVSDYDFRNAFDIGAGSSNNGLSDNLYEYFYEKGDLYAKIVAAISDDAFLPESSSIEINVTPPQEIYGAPGETPGDETPTEVPDWLPTDMSYAKKQELAVDAIKQWRDQLISWNKMALEYQHLMDDIGNHLGRILSRADSVIKRFFQNPDIDPLIVRQMALEASQGPSTISDSLELFRNLRIMATAHPNGFAFAAIWVETRNLTSPSDVVRKVLAQVIQNADERYDYPANYDATDDSWIVKNQPGIISYNNDNPMTGQSIEGSIVDYDGGVTNISYYWQTQDQDGDWKDIASLQQNWNIPGIGVYRARVTYDDNYGTGQEAFGKEFDVS